LFKLDGNQWVYDNLIKRNGINKLNCKTKKSNRRVSGS